jgi:hypothetical protein
MPDIARADEVCDYCLDDIETAHWDSPVGHTSVAYTCERHEARVEALRDADGRVSRAQVLADAATPPTP